MTERWTDERLDRFADKVDRYTENSNDQMNALTRDIQQLIQALYLELPNIKAEIHAIALEANESRDVFHAELVEIKEVVKQQAIAAQVQADTAKVQAENIRMMIEMVNRRQA
jgi:hypothetical protein